MNRKKAFIISGIVAFVTLLVVAWPCYLATNMGMNNALTTAFLSSATTFLFTFNFLAHSYVYTFLNNRKDKILERWDDIMDGYSYGDWFVSTLSIPFFIIVYVIITPFILFFLIVLSFALFVPSIIRFRKDEYFSYSDDEY